MEKCTLCPLACGALRNERAGACGGDDRIRIGFAGAHFGEEPPLVGKRGSGTVFFTGCSLRCVFCQNAAVSVNGVGKVYTESELEKLLLSLAEKCENINLVTAGHMLELILPTLKKVKPKLKVPVVYNSGGYETVEAVRLLEGLVDVYLPDYKYFSPDAALKYSGRKNYPDIARAAIDEMVRQQPKTLFEDGKIKRGVIVRHLVLPGGRHDSVAVVRDIAARWKDRVLISLMSQYTPEFNRSCYPELNRRVTAFEYDSVLDEVKLLGLDGFMQERTSATSLLTPKFTD